MEKPAFWPHAPKHYLFNAGTYMVTAGTYLKAHHFNSDEKLNLLQETLLKLLKEYSWQLEAWAIFSNHYHFIAYSNTPQTLEKVAKRLHGSTSVAVNRIDNTPGRKVWFQYYDTHITKQTSHYARLNYVHKNAVKHGLVADARLYPWCSARWIECVAPASYINTVSSFPIDRVNVKDDF